MKKTISLTTLALLTSCGNAHLERIMTDKVEQPVVTAPIPASPDSPSSQPSTPPNIPIDAGITPIDPGTPVVLTEAQQLEQLKLLCVGFIGQFSFLDLQTLSVAVNAITDLNKIRAVRDELILMNSTYATEASANLKVLLNIQDTSNGNSGGTTTPPSGGSSGTGSSGNGTSGTGTPGTGTPGTGTSTDTSGTGIITPGTETPPSDASMDDEDSEETETHTKHHRNSEED